MTTWLGFSLVRSEGGVRVWRVLNLDGEPVVYEVGERLLIAPPGESFVLLESTVEVPAYLRVAPDLAPLETRSLMTTVVQAVIGVALAAALPPLVAVAAIVWWLRRRGRNVAQT